MLEQMWKEAVSRGWCNSTFDEYKSQVRHRVCIMLGRCVSYDELEDVIKEINSQELD